MHQNPDPYNNETSMLSCMRIKVIITQPYASLIYKTSGIDEIID
ncbi:MAG: hypothetical protein ACI8QG_003049 [Flavobacteriales bacterium]|jgi:hypothetical protein